MKTAPVKQKRWRPRYPESREGEVQLKNRDYSTFMSDEGPVILVSDETIESPACFWIDYEHVYLRTNWSMWSTVSLSDMDQVKAICGARFCRVHLYNVRDYTAPVYHIEALPEELFLSGSDDHDDPEAQDDSGLFEEEYKNSSEEYAEAFQTVVQIVESISDDLLVFKLPKIGNDRSSIVITDTGNRVVILDIAPENRVFFFSSAEGEEKHRVLDNWPTDDISLDFIDKLRGMKEFLRQKEPDSIADIGFLGNTETIEMLRMFLNIEEISDLKLFTYADLGKQIDALFFAPDT